ncbi:unnamed protein product [Discosporangium mesarthrocarpum]
MERDDDFDALLGDADLFKTPMLWFDANWMFVVPPIVFTFYINKIQEVHWLSLSGLAWAAAPLYSFHQFEEHGWDMKGRRYAFRDYFNDTTSQALGVHMTPRLLTIINVCIVSVFFSVMAYVSDKRKNYVGSSFAWSIAFANSIMGHLVPWLLLGKYNPGAFQSLFMCPISAFVLWRILKHHGTLTRAAVIFFGSVWGHGVAMMLPLVLVAKGILTEFEYLLWVVVALGGFVGVVCPLLDAHEPPKNTTKIS